MESGSVEAVFSSPSHPYTESLLAAVHPPDPDHRPTRLAVPADGLGQNPDATPPAEGCPFAPRCHRRIGALCFERPPPLRESGADGHHILCHHEAAALQVPPPLDRKSTRRTPVTNAHLVCRLLLVKKQHLNACVLTIV